MKNTTCIKMRFWLILGGRHTAAEKDTNLMDVFMRL